MARASSGGRVTSKASIRKASMARGRGAALKRAAAGEVKGGGEPTVVFFDDIRRVRDLLGDYDAKLAVLEDRLGVEAVVNGNAVSLRGPETSCATAKSVLEQLYGRLAQGEMIGVGEVVGAIRHARSFEPDESLEPGADAGAKRLPRIASAQRSRLRHRSRRHRQDLSRRRLCRGVSGEREMRPADPVAPRGRGRRAARLPSRRHAREGRSLFAAALRRSL